MEITLHKIKVRDLVAGYRDEGDEGVYGYGGKLDIRPPYALSARIRVRPEGQAACH